MARARNIKPGFFKNDLLVELDFATRLCFPGLWTIADRAGRLEDRPKKIKMEIFPADNVDIDGMLAALTATGFLIRYEVEGARYIQIVNWDKHQNPHHTEKGSVIPPVPNGYQPPVTPDVNGEPTVKEARAEEPLTVKRVHEGPLITVDSPSENGGNLADSLIHRFTDSLIPDSPNPEQTDLSLSTTSSPKNDDPVSEIFAYWQKRMDSPRSALDDKRRKIIKAALKNYSPADLCRAIRGCSLTPHNMGTSAEGNGQKYNGIALIFRSSDQIDRFIANDITPPRANGRSGGVAAHNDAIVAAYLAGDTAPSDDHMTVDMEH
jgi:hypothetical protein